MTLQSRFVLSTLSFGSFFLIVELGLAYPEVARSLLAGVLTHTNISLHSGVPGVWRQFVLSFNDAKDYS